MLKIWLILVLLTGFPVGYFLAYLCRDELVKDRKWYMALGILSLAVSLVLAFLNYSKKIEVILTLFYMAIVAFIAIHKSYDKRFLSAKNKERLR